MARHLRCVHAPGLEDGAVVDRRRRGQVGQGRRDRPPGRGARLRLALALRPLPQRAEPAHEAVFECWTTVAAISQRTSRIRLGQMVGCNSYRNPALLAKMTSTFDVISGGRLDWGIGAGWYQNEYQGYGYEFPPRQGPHRDAARGGRDRAVDVDRGRDDLRRQATTRSSGPTATPSRCSSPTRRSSSAAAASSSRCGSSPAWPTARTSAASPTSSPTSARCSSSTARTWAATTTRSRRRGHPRSSSGRPRRRSPTPGSRSFWGEPFESWAAGNLVGTPEQVAEKIRTYIDLGCTWFMPWCSDYPDDTTLRVLRREGHPRVQVAGLT